MRTGGREVKKREISYNLLISLALNMNVIDNSSLAEN
jgi:hypothetical protein